MDLFTYLMAKNGNNTSVHGDLFSYLLGKGQSQTQTISGVTIYIPDAKKLVSFMMTKESTQYTTRGVQLFDKNNANILDDYYVASKITYDSNSKTLYVPCNANTTYTIQKISSARFVVATTNSTPVPNISVYNRTQDNTATKITITTNSTAQYIVVYYYNAGSDTLTEQEILDSIMIEEGETATEWEEYTGGQPSPNPDYPQEVNVVEGYRNLFDKDNANIKNGLFINANNLIYSTGTSGINTLYINIQPNKKYSISKISSNVFRVATSVNIPEHNGLITNAVANNTGTFITITSGINDNYLAVSYYQSTTDTLTEQEILDSIMIVEGDQELPYVPYGNNYVAVNVSDGTNTNNYPIPLNNNELVGIGDYKDELLVDKSGHVFINKKCGKYIFTGNEGWRLRNTQSSGIKSFSVNMNVDYKIDSSILNDYKSNYLTNLGYVNGASIMYTRGIGFSLYYGDVQGARTIYMNTMDSDLQTFNNNVAGNNLYYVLETPELIDLQTTVDINLFKGANTITNSEDGYMTIEYR